MTSTFTRMEVLAMTGAKPSNLSYLDKTELVKPLKRGHPKRPQVTYTVEQIIEIKVIERLREKLSLQEIRKVLKFLRSKNHSPSSLKGEIVFIGKDLYLIEDAQDLGTKVLQVSGRSKGQIAIHEIGPLGDVLSELKKEAREREILDFDKRSKGTLLEQSY